VLPLRILMQGRNFVIFKTATVIRKIWRIFQMINKRIFPQRLQVGDYVKDH